MTRRLASDLVVTVEAPATSANLGPGFDCFGLALSWRERLTVATATHGVAAEVSGEGAGQLPRDETHLVLRSVLAGLADLGADVDGLRLTGHNTIPHGRGLGSSSAAIVAGLVAAWALARDDEVDRSWLLRHAAAIEGHPDNVAAAIHGGFVLAYESVAGTTVAQPPVHPDVAVVALVPAEPVATTTARGLLPATVPHADAAANASRSALFVHGITSDPSALWEGTRDWLHQGYRQPAMPGSYALVQRLRDAGWATVISGAGPTVLVIGRRDDLDAQHGWPAPGFTAHRLSVGAPAAVTTDSAR